MERQILTADKLLHSLTAWKGLDNTSVDNAWNVFRDTLMKCRTVNGDVEPMWMFQKGNNLKRMETDSTAEARE